MEKKLKDIQDKTQGDLENFGDIQGKLEVLAIPVVGLDCRKTSKNKVFLPAAKRHGHAEL